MYSAAKDRRNLLATLVLLLLCLSLVLLAMPERERLLRYAILWPLTVATLLLMVLHLPKKITPVVWAGIGMSVWALLCNVINGDLYLQFNLRYVYGIALAFGLGLCLMPVLGDRWERWLPAFLLAFALYALALAAISCYSCYRDRLIQLPFTEGTIGIIEYRLYGFNKHPNELGCILNLGLLCWMMLAFRAPKWWLKVPCVLALLPICFTISLTVSRTTITLTALALGGFCLVRFTRKPTFLRWLAGLVVMALVFAGSLWTMMTGIPQMLPSGAPQAQTEVQEAPVVEEVPEAIPAQPSEEPLADPVPVNESIPADEPAILEVASAEQPADEAAQVESEVRQDQHLWQRSYTDNIGTFSMRTDLWKAGIQYLKDRPVTLLIGSTDGNVARIPGRMLGRSEYHLHNAWLEVLAQAGIPGFVMMLFVFLRMFWGSARLFFSSSTPGWMRILAAAPVLMTACTLMETYPAVSANVSDMMMMLLCGAVIAADIQQKNGSLQTKQ